MEGGSLRLNIRSSIPTPPRCALMSQLHGRAEPPGMCQVMEAGDGGETGKQGKALFVKSDLCPYTARTCMNSWDYCCTFKGCLGTVPVTS